MTIPFHPSKPNRTPSGTYIRTKPRDHCKVPGNKSTPLALREENAHLAGPNAYNKRLALSLTTGTKKRRTLCLNDPHHTAIHAAIRTRFIGTVVNAVMILIVACLI